MNPERIPLTNEAEEFLKKELEPLFQEKGEVWGYGTDRADAENIIQNGFFAKESDLAPRAISIENTDRDIRMIFDWSYQSKKYIVLFIIPNAPERPPNALNDWSLWKYDKEKQMSVIPPDKIYGYIRVPDLKLVKNERYRSTATTP